MPKKTKKISTFGSRATSVVSVALVLVLLGLMAMGGLMARALSQQVRQNLGFVIKMDLEATPAQVDALSARLADDAGIESATWLSPADILAQERALMGDSLASELDFNPFQGEFEIRFKPSHANVDSMAGKTEILAALPGVDEVVTQAAVARGVERTFGRIGRILGIAAAILLFISIALINNTVSLSIYSRRFLVHTMRLVGATSPFIRAPFVRAGVVNGLCAGVMASAVLLFVRAYGAGFDPLIESALSWRTMVLLCVALWAVGALLCAATAWVSVTRFLRSSYDDLFLS